MHPIDISIIVCCYNSADRLPNTLRHLADQEFTEDRSCEVVLVDNASTDRTATVAQALWDSYGSAVPLRVVVQPKPGLSHAREAGLAAAAGRVISFVDDDNWVCPAWNRLIVEAFGQDPGLGALGGRGIAAFEDDLEPSWFEHYQSRYAVGPQPLPPPGSRALPKLYGAGLAVRRSALDGLKDTSFAPRMVGRSGKALTSGDDSELCYALALSGWRFAYEPALSFQHFMPQKRLSPAYLCQMLYGHGYASATEDLYLQLAAERTLAARLRGSMAVRMLKASIRWAQKSVAAMTAGSAAARMRARVAKHYFGGRLKGLLDSRTSAAGTLREIAEWMRRATADEGFQDRRRVSGARPRPAGEGQYPAQAAGLSARR